jgi:hypothetical protein
VLIVFLRHWSPRFLLRPVARLLTIESNDEFGTGTGNLVTRFSNNEKVTTHLSGLLTFLSRQPTFLSATQRITIQKLSFINSLLPSYAYDQPGMAHDDPLPQYSQYHRVETYHPVNTKLRSCY